MSKIKAIMTAGILIAGGSSINTSLTGENTPETDKTITLSSEKEIQKRVKQNVYHRFEDIPAISDQEAAYYDKDEYTYIINAELYQQTGKIELKRVLAEEVTQANVFGLVYRSECGTYIPQKNEDQLICYDIDMKLISSNGLYKGPSQMDDVGIKSFMVYLAANPQTREYVLPLIKFNPSTKLKKRLVNKLADKDISADSLLNLALKELELLYFDENGNARPMSERESAIHSDLFKSFKANGTNWEKIASPQLKKYINKKGLSNITKNYLCLTETFPSEQAMLQALEEYNLEVFPLGRSGKPKQIILALALTMNCKDKNGNLDATRVPTYAVAAAISTVNWHGNGSGALKAARSAALKNSFRHSWSTGIKELQKTIKHWVTGKSRTYGVNEISKLNMLTPHIIQQYQQMELAGADELARNYQKAVQMEEAKIQKELNLSMLISKQKQR